MYCSRSGCHNAVTYGHACHYHRCPIVGCKIPKSSLCNYCDIHLAKIRIRKCPNCERRASVNSIYCRQHAYAYASPQYKHFYCPI